MSERARGGEGGDTALAQFILGLRSRGLTDRPLLNAFERTPRAPFLPRAPAAMLYEPVTLPLPCGEAATDPFLAARLVKALDVAASHDILEIGTGSGFLTAILARLGRSVTTLERMASLHKAAAAALVASGVRNVVLHHDDGLAFTPEAERFDRILINGAVSEVPPALFAGLKPDGRLIAPIGTAGGGELRLWDRTAATEAASLGIWRLGALKPGLPQVL